MSDQEASNEPVRVQVSSTDGQTFVECSECGPVALTDLDPHSAAVGHLALTHGCNHFLAPDGETYPVEDEGSGE